MHRLLTPRIVGLALVATALVATQAAAPATAVQAANGPMYGAPKAGSCYAVSGTVAMTQSSTTATSRSCRTSHTLWIYAVGAVPASVDLSQTANNPGLNAAARKICTAPGARVLGTFGRSWGLSSYESFAFLPTKAQQAQGARWLSCEFGILAGKDRLATSRKVKPARLSMHPKNLFASCTTARLALTNCAATHAYRATYAQVFSGSTTTADHKTLAICRKHMRGNNWVYFSKHISSTRIVAVCSARNRH